jgi:hypothetical protein
MKLTNKQKALGITVGLFAGAVATVFAAQFAVENVSAEVLGYICLTALTLSFGSLVYQIVLNRIEYHEQLNKMVDKK